MALISIVTPCFNEEDNVEALVTAVRNVMSAFPHHDFEHVFIDNCSQDRTVEIIKRLAASDKRVKAIVNVRNFGPSHVLHAYFQVHGDAIIPLAADFQDPPELLAEFIKRWDEGWKVVAAVKKGSEERFPMNQIRRLYYRLIDDISEVETIKGFHGFGLYDRRVIEIIRSTRNHKPYWRGLICQIGYPIAQVEYVRPTRKRGFSKNNFYSLYSEAMNGLTAQSKVPLRVATFTGLLVALGSALVAAAYLVYKLVYWNSFSLGVAPIVCGFFFFSAVQLVFLGVIGEYLGSIHERIFQKWIVVEQERVNFDEPVQLVPSTERSLPSPPH